MFNIFTSLKLLQYKISRIYDLALYFFKKYVYTVNHKRIALNYLYFSFWTGLSGASLATMIRLELAYPGSHFFKGDSIKYLQVITGHGLIMVFFVVVPVIFGFFANFFIPYHIGSKDVAFPRLNSIGFWILPSGFLLLAKSAFLRRQIHNYRENSTNYNKLLVSNNSWIFNSEELNTQLYVIEGSANKGESSKHTFVTDNNGTATDKSPISINSNNVSFFRLSLKNSLTSSYNTLDFYKNFGVQTATGLNSTINNKDSGFNSTISDYALLTQNTFISNWTQLLQQQNSARFDFLNKNNNLLDASSSVRSVKFSQRKQLHWPNLHNYYEPLWHLFRIQGTKKANKSNFVTKCPSSSYTMSGWTFITPFSSNLKYTGYGAQDLAVLGVIFAGVSTTISFTNLLITRRTLSMPGLRHRKSLIPFLSLALFLTMRMLALITPVLGAAMIMLSMDRHWGTSFFDYTYGGDLVLFHHLFWFFGHPEVYVVIIPSFGIVNMLLPFYNTRRITSKNHLIWTTYVMAYMGFLVWGHHMYLIGLDNRSRSFFSTITLMIALPAVVKIVNWTLTLLNGAFKWDVSILFVFTFFTFFLSGGLTGMWLSHVALNLYVHDTFYVVAHFHFLFSAATFSAIFAGLYYYFPILFGIKYSRFFAYCHLVYWFVGQWLTFLPLFWVGYNGLPRRYHDYPIVFMGWQGLATAGHVVTLVSVVFFFFMLLDSHLLNKCATISHFGIPRWHKRINYYTYKIKSIQRSNSKVSCTLPYTFMKTLSSNV